MNDDIIGTIAIAAAGLALVAAAGIIARAWLVSREKRRRLAAAYDGRIDPRERPQAYAPRVWPHPPAQRVAAGTGASGRTIQGTVRATVFPGGGGGGSSPTPARVDRGPFRRPSAPASPSPVYYGDPVPLDLSSSGGGAAPEMSLSSTTFEGGGGSFAGGGASGGWDAPSSGDNGGGYSDTGGGDSGGSSGGDSGGGSSD
jgi:hypothetical protein